MLHPSFLIHRTRLAVGLVALACALAARGAAGAASGCQVPSTAYPTIQSAVNDTACTTISVAAEAHTENVTINRNVTIRGDGSETTIVHSGGNGTVFRINSGTVTIRGVANRNSSALAGGGIGNESAWPFSPLLSGSEK